MKKLTYAVMAGLLVVAGCTTKKERAPGPLTVWIAAEDSELMGLRMQADDFRRQTGIPLELVTKSVYDMQFSLLRHPEDLAGVDVVEVDYFDLPELAGRMANLKKVLETVDGGGRLYGAAINAGMIGGSQTFIPWRITWPAMVTSSDYSQAKNFSELASRAEADQLTVMMPALDDRELFALLCAMAWSVQADPAKPGPGMAGAMELYSRFAAVVPMEASAASPGSAAEMSQRPDIILDWPRGILAIGTDIPLELESVALPCGDQQGKCVPFFGRYLASPRDAPHPEEAITFIRFMISPEVQSRLANDTEWLPVRSDGLTDLAGREDAYRGITAGAPMLRALPTDEKARKALASAGRKILFEGADAEQGLEEFNRRMQ